MAEVKDYSAEALLAKEKEVELDTDDVKEESIELEQKEETKKEPNLNLGEVDLGYTDHSKPKEEKSDKPEIEITEEKEQPKQETKEEKETEEKPNLQESRRDYQKRIDKLVFQKKEAERREKAALDFAKGLQKKFDQTSIKYQETDEQYLKELDARVDAQREQVKVALKQAIENNDSTQIMEANDKLTQLAVEKEKARQELQNRERRKKEEEQKSTTTNNVQAEPQTAETSEASTQITPRAKKWAEENTWFGTDEVMTNAAITIHNNISQEGIEVDSDEYYNEVNSRLRKYFPESFDNTKDEPKKETPKPVQTVASAGRSQQGRRTVKLTKSQVAIAKRLGVPLEEYARYVKEEK
jgi:triacylglycerol lipase